MTFNRRSLNPQRSDDYEHYLEQGTLLLQQGDLDGALSSFKQSIKLNPAPEDNPLAYLRQGLVLIEKQNFSAAIKLFDVIIEVGILPALYIAYMYKGETLISMERWKESEQVFSDGISLLTPNRESKQEFTTGQFPELRATMHYNRAITRMSQSKFRDAAEDYGSAILLYGQDPDYYAGRCIALLKSGNVAGAKNDYEFLQRNVPTHPIVRQLATELAPKQTLVQSVMKKAISGSSDPDSVVEIIKKVGAKKINLNIPEPKYPDSAEKRDAVRQLVQERYYDAAALVLDTMASPTTDKWVQRVKNLLLARSMQSHQLGVLEEWISDNQHLFSSRFNLMRDAITYLRDDEREHSLGQLILGKLSENEGLCNIDLSRVSLDGVDFSAKHISNSDLSMSSLQKVNFRGCYLHYSKFIGADLREADFSGADCFTADFSRADLRGANLSGTNLMDAEMSGAFISGAKFNKLTKLPDGTLWTPSITLEEFTGIELFSQDDNSDQ